MTIFEGKGAQAFYAAFLEPLFLCVFVYFLSDTKNIGLQQ